MNFDFDWRHKANQPRHPFKYQKTSGARTEYCPRTARLMTGGFTLLQVCEIGILVFLEPSPLRELPHAADVSGETTTLPTGKRAHCLSHRRRRRSDEARLVASYSRAKWSSGGRPPRLSAHARMVEAFRVAKSTHSPGPGQLLRAQSERAEARFTYSTKLFFSTLARSSKTK